MNDWLGRIAAVCGLLLSHHLYAQERCLLSFDAGRFDACNERNIDIRGPLIGLAGRSTDADGAGSVWVIKFAAPITTGDRQQLTEMAAQVIDYLPWHAYLVRMPAGRSPVGRIANAIWIGAMAPAWKLSGGLNELLAQDSLPAAVPLTIALAPGADTHALLQQWRAIEGVAHGFAITGARSDRLVLSVEGAHLLTILETIAPAASVTAITLRKQMQYLNARAGWLHQSGTQDERPVFDQGLIGCGQIVGVLDSGVDFSHCAFYDDINGDPPISVCNDGAACAPGIADFLQRKTAFYYKWSGAGDALGDAACDPNTGAGHGTHVAGSITGNPSGMPVDCEAGTLAGVPGNLDGTAPGAHLIAQEMGGGLEYVNDLGGTIYHAATTAYSNGARIHSNSWGGSCCFLGIFCLPGCTASYDEFARDADEATWEFPDLLVAIAAGNNGTCCASTGGAVGSPGLAKSALTVGASGAGTSGENAASFSSRGPTLDRRTKPDVMAQGDGIVSSSSDGNAGSIGCSTCTFSGTSMATPTAAGLAALVREYLNRGFYPGGSENGADEMAAPSAALLKALMINGARDMGGTGATAVAPNQVEGWGRIHLDDVLYFDGDTRRLWLIDEASGVETGEADSYTLAVDDTQPLKITLVWSDRPGALNANPSIVNRLRLEVEAPGGAVWTQKLPAAGVPNPTQSTTTDGYDDRNVVHQIRFAAPVAGDYTVRVRGIDVALGKPGQPYALVATGDIEAPEPSESANLSLGKSALTPVVAVGAAIQWQIDVANAGPGDATGVTVTDTLPASVTGIVGAGTGWNCSAVGQTLTCNLAATLANGANAAPIIVDAAAPQTPGLLTNNASVDADQADPVPGNNGDSADINVTLASVDLGLDKQASAGTVAAGEAFDYQLTVSTSADGAENLEVVDTLPAGLCVTAISAPGWDCALDADTLTCAIAGPLAGQPSAIALSAIAPNKGGILTNSASVGADNPDPNGTNDTDSIDVTVTGAPADRIFASDFEPAPSCL